MSRRRWASLQRFSRQTSNKADLWAPGGQFEAAVVCAVQQAGFSEGAAEEGQTTQANGTGFALYPSTWTDGSDWGSRDGYGWVGGILVEGRGGPPFGSSRRGSRSSSRRRGSTLSTALDRAGEQTARRSCSGTSRVDSTHPESGSGRGHGGHSWNGGGRWCGDEERRLFGQQLQPNRNEKTT